MISNIKPLLNADFNFIGDHAFLTPLKDFHSGIEDVNNSVEIIFCGSHEWARNVAITLLNLQLPFINTQLTELLFLDEAHSSEIIPRISGNGSKIAIIISQSLKGIKHAFDAFQFMEKPFSVSLCQKEIGHNESIDQTLLDLRAPWLQHLALIGSQAQFTNANFLDAHQKPFLSTYRLGVVRKNIGKVEPELRMSELVGLDLTVLKSSEVQSESHTSSVGFTMEELCQLAYYTGRSEQNQVFSIHNCSESPSIILQDALATLIWYFVYGLDMRGMTYPPDLRNMVTYVVEGSIYSETLTFYKDDLNQKWWLKSPFPKKKLTKSNPLIACDYEDYSTAVNEQMLTERLEKALERHENSEDILDPQTV